MKIAVLGCGPSGLVAAQAASLSGCEVEVWSKKKKSDMFGAQYLHEQIPGIDTETAHISYKLWGTEEGYRSKVYGAESEVRVSPEDLVGSHYAWDIRRTYDTLWQTWEGSVRNAGLTHSTLRTLLYRDDIDLIINTVPAYVVCLDSGHEFRSQLVWAAGDAPSLGVKVEHNVRGILADNTVICSGESRDDWYRASNIFGHVTMEWPLANKVGLDYPDKPYPTASRVQKPINNTCTCYEDDKLFGVGRYGAWRKGVLVHECFWDTLALIGAFK